MTSPAAPAAPAAEPAAAPAPQAPTPPLEAASPFLARTEPAPETTQPVTPGTVPGGAPETQEPATPSAEPPKAPPSWRDELETADEADLREHARIKALLASETEATRRREEAASIERERLAAREYAASADFVRDFEGYARELASKVDADGNVQLDQGRIDRFFRTLLSQGAEEAVAGLGRVIAADMPTDFKPTAEEEELLRAARTEYMRDPVRNGDALTRNWLRMRDRVRDASREAEIERTVTARITREFETRQQEQQARETREGTRQTGGPPPAGGAPTPGTWVSQRQVDAAHARGDITTDAYRQLNADGTYRRLPR